MFLASNLDGLVKQIIERTGSELTGTAVRLGAVEIDLTSGRGTLRNLRVANPDGFSGADVFSLGAILFEIVTGSSPRRALHAAEGGTRTADGRVQDALFYWLTRAGASEELAHLAAECLDLDPEKRPAGASEVAERLTRHLESA